jgi:hypothetical protein
LFGFNNYLLWTKLWIIVQRNFIYILFSFQIWLANMRNKNYNSCSYQISTFVYINIWVNKEVHRSLKKMRLVMSIKRFVWLSKSHMQDFASLIRNLVNNKKIFSYSWISFVDIFQAILTRYFGLLLVTHNTTSQ